MIGPIDLQNYAARLGDEGAMYSPKERVSTRILNLIIADKSVEEILAQLKTDLETEDNKARIRAWNKAIAFIEQG